MKKPMTPILMEVSNMLAIPPSTRFGTRSKRTQSTSDVPARASKRACTQSDMAKKTWTEQPTCIECKKKDKADRLIKCIGNCSNKIHRSCLPPLFGRKREQSYECNNCQSCYICKSKFTDGAKLLKCYHCFTCYHSNCYRPSSYENIRMVKEKRFCCASCQSSQKATPTKQNFTSGRVVRNVLYTVPEARVSEMLGISESEDFLGFSQSDLSTLPNRRSKSVEAPKTPSIQIPHSITKVRNSIDGSHLVNKDRGSIDGLNLTNKNRNIIDDENSIPDASEWTMNEVYEYFKKMFPRHAHVFAEEEIDGQALYKLQRRDVVGGFKLKIGPSLKIYDHILKMQTKLSNRS